MRETVHQGDILKVGNVRYPVLAVSKDFFNHSGEIIGCPIFGHSSESPLHIYISTDRTEGYVQCEKIALLDLDSRGFSITDRIPMAAIIDITDAIQGIFDYV